MKVLMEEVDGLAVVGGKMKKLGEGWRVQEVVVVVVEVMR